jgi:putative transcription antitermination factor YqgF
MLDTKVKVLAIDYGTKRIGLALSFGSLADPLTIISNDQNSIAYICKIVDDYQVGKIIIGLSENETAEKTRTFTELLKRSLSIPIELYDETLSTKAVRNKLEEAHKSQQRRVDHLAAAEFLQEWLDTNN